MPAPTLLYPPVLIGRPHASPPAGQGTVAAGAVIRVPSAATAVINRRLWLPPCQIISAYFDVQTLFDGATAVGTWGSTLGGSDYLGPCDLKVGGRSTTNFTAAQVGVNASFVNKNDLFETFITVTPGAGNTVGIAWFTLAYIPLG